MKKFFLVCVSILMSIGTMFAVPPGTYKDSRGNSVFITDYQNLYKLDRDGRVRTRWQIFNERNDGSFSLRLLDDHDNVINGTIPSTRNGWWQENGEILLNLESSPRTLTRQ